MTAALATNIGVLRSAFSRVWRSIGLAALVGFSLTSSIAAERKLEFNHDIRPILSENCFACHGVDSAARKAGLRLDIFEDATAPRKDNKYAIAPGKPDESEMMRRILTTNEDDLMPPPKSHKVLTAEQKELLRQWIAEGAQYQPHWSLISPSRPAVPQVRNKRSVRNPIDNFIFARLEAENLKPAPEADRRTLARRLSLDILGLPPKSEEVEAFVKDKSPDAYEKYVDLLMSSPHWGEHRGRYWLDAARYGDTHGIHIDNFREMWTYRDWVINAFNRNLPFDQFTIEQLAGDLLPNPTMEQKIASGFNRCNITTSEGGAIDEEYIVLYARDRTETASQVWLGLTAGCAVCHDHKYDRLSQKEFYELSAFFNNTTQKAMDGNVKDTPPIIPVPLKEDRARFEALPAEKKIAETAVEDRKKAAEPDFAAWMKATPADALKGSLPKDAPAFFASLSDNQEKTLAVQVAGKARTLTLATNVTWQDGAVAEKAFSTSTTTTPELADVGDYDTSQSFSVAVWVRLGESRDGGLLSRMNEDDAFRGWDLWLEGGGKPGTHIVHKWPDDALKVVSKKAIEPNRWTHVCLTYDGSAKSGGVKIYIDGESQAFDIQADKLKGTTRTTVPFKIGQRNKTSPVEKAGLQDLRIYSRVLKSSEIKNLGTSMRMGWLVAKPAESRTKEESSELYSRWLTTTDKPYQQAVAKVAAIQKEDQQIRSRGTIAHISNERDTPAEAYVLFRGEYDKRRDKVGPETPEALPPMPADFPKNRLGFAKWLLQPEHPMTTRVTVNRFWQELFGTGIVRTAGDFGVSGEMPSHPELLDWLAVEFRDGGWDVKKFFKLVVTSATYRQSAAVTSDKIAKDRDNRLLSRGPRFRMDAEMVRDYALAASELLVPKIGGPSVKPYQPDGVWEAVAMIGSNTRDYKRDTGENLYRRSVYTFWKRSAPPASMDIFNAPSRETCAVRRERTNTPLQALATLNDTQMVEAARLLAERAIKDGGEKPTERLDYLARRLLARPLKSDERKISEDVLKDLLAHYKAAPKDAEALVTVGDWKADASVDKPTLAAYTMVANQLMNLDEVLNK
jgi:hypothetical protein